jgi:23S rRNA maturation mini-RNase III
VGQGPSDDGLTPNNLVLAVELGTVTVATTLRSSKMDTKQVKKIADKEVKAHEQRMHPGAKKMACWWQDQQRQMLKYGRNMAKSD